MKARLSYGAAAALIGGQLMNTLRHGVIDIFSGNPPTYADDAVRGQLLARITTGGLPWTAGQPYNGLRYTSDGAYIRKLDGDRWILKGVAAGRARWFRVRGHPYDDGAASTTAVRIDGDIAALDSATEAHLILPDVVISPDTSIEINEFWLGLDY